MFDFKNIRPFDGSKNKGFEELVCQLAHLEKFDGTDEFIRKEGAGGDAGVECFWRLKDQNEYGWQAKYFTDEMKFKQVETIKTIFYNGIRQTRTFN